MEVFLSAELLEELVGDLLLNPVQLDPQAQELFLNEIETVVTSKENEMLPVMPSPTIFYTSSYTEFMLLVMTPLILHHLSHHTIHFPSLTPSER